MEHSPTVELAPLNRPLAVLITAISAILVALVVGCSDGTTAGERAIPPTARPVPTVAGQPVEGYAPDIDDSVAIIGVPFGETIEMRALPGIDNPIVAEVPGTETDLYGYGRSFETEDGRLWWMIRWTSPDGSEKQGWIEPGAAYLSRPIDASVVVAGNLLASEFAALPDLVADVTRQYGGEPIQVQLVAAAPGSEASATIDFIAPDERIAGRRLVIAASYDGSAYRLASVQEFELCRRGLNEHSQCR